MGDDVRDILEKAGLDQFSDNFIEQGFTTAESLMILTMQDYGKFGIVQTEDKRKLFQIIQQQKQVKSKDKSKRMSSVLARLTSSEKKAKEKKEAPSEPTPPNSMYFNRATFLRRSFNKTKGTDMENGPNISRQSSRSSVKDRSRCMSSQPLSRRDSNSTMSASAENINRMRTVSANNHNGQLRKSSSGRMDAYSGKSEFTSTRTRAKTSTSLVSSITSSRSKSANKNTSDKIKVCVRKRPLNRKEKNSKEADIISMEGRHECMVSETKTAVDLTKFIQKHCFIFDEVFSELTDNYTVYKHTAKPLVEWVFQGNKATCFAYGQTGSGKTYTMMGAKNTEGIVLLASRDIFDYLNTGVYGTDITAYVSFYEIYCGQLFDLINKRKRLNALENAKKAICIVGLEERQVHSHEDVMHLINQGGNRRSSGSTSVNNESSRSHAILQLELKNRNGKSRGKFSFIDLAGSERAADVSDSTKQTRHEGAEINTSLLALKECIRALDQESKHTPFRQSKLTQVLRDSFIGNSKTCMIASVSPNISSCEDTLNTLRYADRVKELGRDDITPRPEPSAEEETVVANGKPPKANNPPVINLPNDNGHHYDSNLSSHSNHSNHSNHSTRSNHSSRSNNSSHNNFANDTFTSLLDATDLINDLPSDISLVSRTDESDTSNVSTTADQVEVDASKESRGSSSEIPEKPEVSRKPETRDSVLSESLYGSRDVTSRGVTSPTESLYVYPKPPQPPSSTSSKPSHKHNDTSSCKSEAWTRPSPPSRGRISTTSFDKMKKAQDDLIASHQIHISQVTNLCSLEEELLQNFVDGHLEFNEYMKKLETILESKNKCVESLRAQVACYSLRATY